MSGHLRSSDRSHPSSPFLHEWVFWQAQRTPAAPAVATPRHHLDYATLAARVRSIASDVFRAGFEPGDRVLLALPNTPATVVAGLALNSLGVVSVEVNRDWAPEVLAGIVAKTEVRGAFVWAPDVRKWAGIIASPSIERVWVVSPGADVGQLRHPLGIDTTWVLDDGQLPDPPRSSTPAQGPALDVGWTALILYTSGSSGAPQGVIQTFGNVDANSRSIVQYLSLTAVDRALLALPLYYCYGRSVLQTHFLVGGSLFLDSRLAFPRTVLESLADERCTGFAGVPLTFEILRRQRDVSSYSFPALRYVTQAGGAMAPETIRWAREAFAPAHLFVMYGQTEATARLSYLPPERAVDKEGSVGVPIPGVELRVVDEEGRELPAGTTGELLARGSNVTPGYYGDPEGTASILRDGWLWTGDLAYRDADGFVFLRGRARDILKIAGHRVSPLEIEQALEQHPGVLEAAVIGVRDELKGEVPVAVVVAQLGWTPSDDALRQFCRERLPPYSVPARFIFVAALPRNEAGKLQRAAVARECLVDR